MRHLALAFVCAFFASIAAAQPLAGTGSISGTVRDASGAVVAGANVEVVNAERGIRRTTTTDNRGEFAVIALDPASGYKLNVSKAGFTVREQGEIEVLVGEVNNVELTLQITPEKTRISVDAAAIVVDQTKTEVSQVVRNSQILNLPINGRRVDTYALLTPAVVPDGSLGLVSFRGMAGGNSFLTDGNDTSNQYFDENAGRTRIFTQISQDAVQEFQVLSTGYSAAYGRASGGIINTVTRSGSNTLNGTAYWFFRNRGLNARDPYGAINPPERRHQAGASISGPISKDKLFYFFNTEVHRRDFPLISSLQQPPLFDVTGKFVGECGFPATPAQCVAAQQYLSRQFQILSRTADSELLFGKLDWLPTQRHHVSASFNYLRWISPNGFQQQAVTTDGTGVGANGNSTVRARYGRLEWMFVPNGSHINELRFGWFKDRQGDDINPKLIPGYTGLVQITVQDQKNLGFSSDLPRVDPSENRFQITDNYTHVSGEHSLRIGFDFLNTEDYVRYLPNANGSYEYATFTDFAQDFSGNVNRDRNWTTYSQRFGNPIFDETVRDYSLFAEDQYRVSAHVTLHYGLRYEYSALPQPHVANPEYPDSGHIQSVKTNFAPRFGMAASFNRSRTVLRAGYGMFYARYHTGLLTTFFQENGIEQQNVSFDQRFFSAVPIGGPVFPNVLPSAASQNNSPISGVDLTIPGKDFRNAYTHQADIAVEHNLAPELNLSVSLLTSRALHLTTVRDLNIGPPSSDIIYQIDDARGNKIGEFATPAYRLINRVNPKWRRVNSVESGGNSYYDALVVQIRKRLSHGLDGFLAYTWSHAIDYNLGGGADNIFFNAGPRTYANGDYRDEKATSQLDQRHRLVVSSTWQPALTRKTSGWAHALGTGWRLSQISTFASTQPATPVIFVQGVPFPGAAFNSTLNGFGGSARVPFLPAASLPIDKVLRTDARLSRIIPLSDRLNLHLNFDVFNILNHVSDTAVSTLAYQAVNQVLIPVPDLGKGIASQGYPDGTNARRAQVSARIIW